MHPHVAVSTTLALCLALVAPLGAPASNLTGPDFTPPFPSYPSGHATCGSALFETPRRFFGSLSRAEDKTAGIAQGRIIAREVFDRLYAPQRRPTRNAGVRP